MFDYEAKKSDGSKLIKMVLASWCPDGVHPIAKMLHGSTTNTVKGKVGIDKVIQASDIDELDEINVKKLLGLN